MGSESAHTPGSNTEVPTRPRLTSRIVTRDDGREECTIHPEDATPDELLTTWVTALDDTFVDLDSMR
ncbi:hypothetical protein E6P09_08640 [Haloferax mediterranei ATCC 33500]|uniref:DUF7511 domain-containing protein n=1 Tax=Haloferax mediterranei (strain ATCC 33500 / DSM 1411 / JCM 8866 / NBRC 14739 / NCIMB 2177 / R-4) TaxID=523841 RepID=I3R3M9_HALMT|nr:hypothetical protein [Haloferax mediterranei]AFK18839.1 hypothetical protein HFX_1123 [Haloferax mediterranei ATCC 33500]AHZ21795.1 hypothetical protein BM92_03595 [Haloferax mediterranei ATCC 33500]EMA03302.1 hypothetical protein C439_04870 [Haloferax mediterranei ATCC 33500]MDX5988933.1 hypothetical protein [Haloferax mediterranei ATCC 33500]QCQ75329.1 hypothetical protein E6P09_08640 [Haloferax mediterranei ATCC 33500]